MARSQWTKLCRAIPLNGGGQAGTPASAATAASGLPNLWLEIKPVRAIAAQPQVDGNALTLLVGVQAQTRIVASETKPVFPFPNQLDLVGQGNEGRVTIAVPIDIPFGEVSRKRNSPAKHFWRIAAARFTRPSNRQAWRRRAIAC